MIPLEAVFRILAAVDGEAVDLSRKPSVEQQSSFGFGRVSGMLLAVERIRELVNEEVELSNQRERES